jgi:hypothetical protein
LFNRKVSVSKSATILIPTVVHNVRKLKRKLN